MILKRYSQQDEGFLRRVVFPEEDRQLFTTAPWRGEYRWFRSPNVVPIEHWRRTGEVAKNPIKSALALYSHRNCRGVAPARDLF